MSNEKKTGTQTPPASGKSSTETERLTPRDIAGTFRTTDGIYVDCSSVSIFQGFHSLTTKKR
jgi:hypothetical protein